LSAVYIFIVMPNLVYGLFCTNHLHLTHSLQCVLLRCIAAKWAIIMAG